MNESGELRRAACVLRFAFAASDSKPGSILADNSLPCRRHGSVRGSDVHLPGAEEQRRVR